MQTHLLQLLGLIYPLLKKAYCLIGLVLIGPEYNHICELYMHNINITAFHSYPWFFLI